MQGTKPLVCLLPFCCSALLSFSYAPSTRPAPPTRLAAAPLTVALCKGCCEAWLQVLLLWCPALLHPLLCDALVVTRQQPVGIVHADWVHWEPSQHAAAPGTTHTTHHTPQPQQQHKERVTHTHACVSTDTPTVAAQCQHLLSCCRSAVSQINLSQTDRCCASPAPVCCLDAQHCHLLVHIMTVQRPLSSRVCRIGVGAAVYVGVQQLPL